MREMAGTFRTLLLLAAGLATAAADSPFRAVTQTRLGTPIVRPVVVDPQHPPLYDLQPSILYDTAEPNPARRFKMWWLGQHPTADPADRIYYGSG